jgi:DNA polymerase-3 subunit delta'
MAQKEMDFSVRFSPFVNERNVIGIMNELEMAENDVMHNVNPRIVFFDFALKMIVLLIQ